MKKLCQDTKCDSETIVQTFHGTNMLLLSPLVKFYLDRGIICSNVTRFIQYTPGKCFQPFVKKVVQMRTEAKIGQKSATTDLARLSYESKSLTAKLFGNSSYGKTGEVVSRHRETKIFTDESKRVKYYRSPLFRHESVIESEDPDFWCCEISSDKKTIKDDKPIAINVAILQYSKLHFLR